MDHVIKQENTTESNGGERASGTAKEITKVEAKQEMATDRQSERSGSGGGGRRRSHERNGRRDRSRDRQYDRERQRRGDRSRGGDRGPSKGSIYKPRTRPECRVYISNIPFEYRWQELKDLFRNEVGEVSFVELFEDEHGNPRGCGIIEFEKVEHARIALDKMHRYDLKGRKLVVKEDFDVDRDACGRVIGRSRDDSREDDRAPLPSSSSSGRPYRDVLPRGGSSNGNGVGGANGSANGALMGTLACPSVTQWSNTFGLSPQFLESLGISGPLVSRVFVANLDYKVDDSKLREVFRLAGKVICAEVTKDKDFKSRGFGVVEMDHPVEAVQAISMFNNQMLYDRRMTVRMDREAERVDYRPQKLPEGLRSIGMGLGAGGNPLQDVSRGVSVMPPSSGSVGISSISSGHSEHSGSSLMAGALSMQSVASMQSLAQSQSAMLQSLSSMDMGRSASASAYGLPASSNGSLTAVGGIGTATYGYSTESARTLSSAQDYDRRDPYDSYRMDQQLDRDRQEYRPTSTSYDFSGRMAPLANTGASVVLGAGSRVSDTIVVTNLPVSCTWQDLRDKFCEVGDVLFADIRAKGTGIVRFSSERDAQRACSLLNRTRMEGRTIEVDFY